MKCPVCRATYRAGGIGGQGVLRSASRAGIRDQGSGVREERGIRDQGSGVPSERFASGESFGALREQESGIGKGIGEGQQVALNCRRCGVDLAPLIRLHDQAIWHHRQAIQAFQEGDYATAIAQNNQALALSAHQADFHTLAGQLWALQGDFAQAIAAWKMAQRLDAQHPTATRYLQALEAIVRSDRSTS